MFRQFLKKKVIASQSLKSNLFITPLFSQFLMELLDIVDDNDLVVGTCTRDEAHSKGLTHRSVLFFIFDSSRRITTHKFILTFQYINYL